MNKSFGLMRLMLALVILVSLRAEASASFSENEDLIVDSASCVRMLLKDKKRPIEAAKPLLDKCLALPDLNITLQALLLGFRAEIYKQQKKWPLAIADYVASFQLVKPKEGWDVIKLSSAYYENEQYVEAINVLQNAMRDDLGEVGRGTGFGMPMNYHLARSLLKTGKNSEAIEALTLGLEKQPDFAYAYWFRSIANENLGKETQARADMQAFAKYVKPSEVTSEEKSRMQKYGVDLPTR